MVIQCHPSSCIILHHPARIQPQLASDASARQHAMDVVTRVVHVTRVTSRPLSAAPTDPS